MRELQDQLEAEQYFSVSTSLTRPCAVMCHVFCVLCVCVCVCSLNSPLPSLPCPPSDALQNSGEGAEGGDRGEEPAGAGCAEEGAGPVQRKVRRLGHPVFVINLISNYYSKTFVRYFQDR